MHFSAVCVTGEMKRLPNGQACTQYAHPMHRSPSTITTPSLVRYEAPTGHTWTQGVALQWLHIFGTKNDFVAVNPTWTGPKPSFPPFGESTWVCSMPMT